LTEFNGISISDVQADSKELVRVEATAEKPLDGLTLSNISGTCTKGLLIRNATNVVLKNINLTGISGPTLLTENVQGTGLDGAAPAPPLK
jgi:pectate lyase